MVQLTLYGERVLDRINMIGMWVAAIICIHNFFICYRHYKRTRGFIHLMNMTQVIVLFIHRFIYGIVPLFEITTCAFWPLLVSLWHLKSDKYSVWIKAVGIALITLRFSDWPYELAFHSLQQEIMTQQVAFGSNCLAQWGKGVIILNFVSDILANLFLSGMFVRRLYVHILNSRKVMSHRNQVIEYIARRSLICLILTLFTNFTMNLFKLTNFMGNRSDTFTPYFEIIESSLLVEALRVDYTRLPEQSFCENCGVIINSNGSNNEGNRSQPKQSNPQHDHHIKLPTRSFTASSIYTDINLPLFIEDCSSPDQQHPLNSISIHQADTRTTITSTQ